jgi:hypothetical protein
MIRIIDVFQFAMFSFDNLKRDDKDFRYVLSYCFDISQYDNEYF